MHYPSMFAIYLKGQMLKFKIKIRYIRIFSCLHSSNDFQAKKWYVINLEHSSLYMLYKSPLQTLITTMRLHRNTSLICATLMREKKNPTKLRCKQMPNKIQKSHKCSQFIFACWFVGLSNVIFTKNILYFFIKFFIKVQHQNPFSFHILENLVVICLQDFNKFCELEVHFR